ncbi:tape measure protein [Parabacteroides johnsonii]|uniref:tape measure protein n=1 Tax=Parabacteroides johnsonii TaxID=387661 RepID=UPI00242E5117|nr:tape measure protein [Parabacteroides johnsonii]
MNTDNGQESYGLALDIDKFSKDVARAEKMFQSVGDKAVSEGQRIDSTFRSVGTAVGGYFAIDKILDFGKTLVNVRGEIESFQISFDVLLGNKEKAASFFKELKQFAVETPLMLNDLSKGAQLLLGFGVEADRLMPTLKQIGDISMGDAQRFNSLALAFAQMSATGKLMGQDLLQMVNAGFNPLKTMSETTGKSVAQLKDEMSKGAISSEMVAQAFADATAQGGKFNGMLKKQSEGIKGGVSNLMGAIDDAYNDFATKNQGLITDSIAATTSLVKNYEKVGKILLSLIGTYGAYRVALALAIEMEKGYSASQVLKIKYLLMAEKAQKLLNKAMLSNPYVATALAIGTVVTALIAYANRTTDAERAQNEYNKKKEEAAKAESEHKQEIENLITTARDEYASSLDRVDALNKLKDAYPGIIQKYIDEEGHLKDILGLKKEIAGIEAQKKVDDNKNIVADYKAQIKAVQDEIAFRRQNYGYGQYKNPLLQSKTTNQLENELKRLQADVVPHEKEQRQNELNQWQIDLKKETDVKIKAELDEAKRLQAMRKNNPLYTLNIMEGSLRGQISGDELNRRVDVLQSEYDLRNKKSVSYEEAYKKAKDDWEKAKKELSAIEKDKDKFTKEQFESAKKNAETKEKAYKDLGGVTGSSLNKQENAKKKAQEAANELKVEQAEREKKIDEYNRTRINQEKQSEFEIRQARIDAMKEGFDKQKAEIDLTYDRLIEENRKRQEDWVKELQNKEREEWINKNPNYKKEGKVFTPASAVQDLSEEQRNALKEYTDVANEYQRAETDKLYKELLDKYRNFEQRRTKINKDFDKERKAIEENKTLSSSDKNAFLVELEKKRKEALKGLNNEEIAEMQKSSDLMIKLFEDTSNKSTAEINKTMAMAKELMSYLSSTNAEDITPKFGFTADQLKALKASPKDIKAIQKAVEELFSASIKRNPFSALIKGLKELFSEGKEGEKETPTEVKLARIGESAAEAADMIGDIAGKLSDMFEAAGNDGAADAMDTVEGVMSTVSNIGKGFAEGGIVGGIAAAAGEAIGWITKAFQANARHKKALEEIMNETIAQQREYNLALMEQNLEYEKATTIFGTDEYGKAANAVTVLKNAVSDLNGELKGTGKYSGGYLSFFNGAFGKIDLLSKEQRDFYDAYAGLADIEIKTGHKKTGLFGWGKGKDIYSSILDVYPELIDGAGNFNKELAETIVNTREMSDKDKAAFQNMIDLAEQAEKALQSVKDYLTEIFGEFGNTITDALVDAFKNGKDAAEAFADSVSGMLEKLAKQMIYSVTLAPYIEKAQEQMLETMKNESLTDEQKFNNYATILDNLTSGVLSEQEEFNALLEKYKQIAENKGIEIFKPDENAGRSATSKATVQASQESVDRVDGRLTVMQGHTFSMADSLKVLVSISTQILEKLAGIESNTSNLEDINDNIDNMKTVLGIIHLKGLKIKK